MKLFIFFVFICICACDTNSDEKALRDELNYLRKEIKDLKKDKSNSLNDESNYTDNNKQKDYLEITFKSKILSDEELRQLMQDRFNGKWNLACKCIISEETPIRLIDEQFLENQLLLTFQQGEDEEDDCRTCIPTQYFLWYTLGADKKTWHLKTEYENNADGNGELIFCKADEGTLKKIHGIFFFVLGCYDDEGAWGYRGGANYTYFRYDEGKLKISFSYSEWGNMNCELDENYDENRPEDCIGDIEWNSQMSLMGDRKIKLVTVKKIIKEINGKEQEVKTTQTQIYNINERGEFIKVQNLETY